MGRGFASWVCGVAIVFCACRAPDASEPRGPATDVLLITVDTLRADRLSAYGFSHETSPRIDALAARGALFERAIAAAPTTSASHASIFTSRYVREHSVGHASGRTRLVGATTLAERFRDAGYATAAFVSNANLARRIGLDRGFEVYDDRLPTRELNRENAFERIAEETARRALAWLVSGPPREAGQLLWVHLQDPHGPYAPPDAYVGRFEVAPQPGEEALPMLDDNIGYRGVPRYQALEGLDRPSQYEGRYADEIFYADVHVGRVLDAAEESARSRGRELIVLLTSDHGERMGELGGYFVHGGIPTPDLARVPMILVAPSLRRSRQRFVVSHVDVAPTLLELAGLASLPAASGVALGPILRGEAAAPSRLVYSDSGGTVAAYRADRFVYAGPTLETFWDAGPEPDIRWNAFDWARDGSFVAVSDDVGLGRVDREFDATEAYFRSTVAMEHASEPSVEDVEALQKLGYIE